MNGVTVIDPTPREAIDQRLQTDQPQAALALARTLWRAEPNAGVARFLAARLRQFHQEAAITTHRVAFLRSFTLEPVVPFVVAEAALDGCQLETWVGEFNAYGQEILARDSGLYAFEPQTVILAIQARDLTPRLWTSISALSAVEVEDAIAHAVDDISRLVVALRANCGANIVVHGLETPLHPERGLLDLRGSLGQADAFAEINRRLRRMCVEQIGVYFLDYDELQARHGRLNWLDERKWATARLPFSVPALGWMAAAWWRYLHPLARPPTKALALDLDNTLWGGTVGEDGLDGIALGGEAPGVYFRAFQQALLDISRRGILLTVLSKNNATDALEVLTRHPGMVIRPEHVSAMRIDWSPKPANLLELARELGIGADSFIFLDDNPVECEAMRRALPQVRVVELSGHPSTFADTVRGLPNLERLTASTEDLTRSQLYSQERERKALAATTESLDDFLRSLDIQIEVEPVTAATMSRAAQLTQKTNQLNTTTLRYSESELGRLLQGGERLGLTLKASDRFGDNGIVGLAILRPDGAICEIESFLMSCRVIGRSIETAFLARLAEVAAQLGANDLQGWFRPTKKNAPASVIYEKAGFARTRIADDGELWSISLRGDAVVRPAWIDLASCADTSKI